MMINTYFTDGLAYITFPYNDNRTFYQDLCDDFNNYSKKASEDANIMAADPARAARA